MPEGAETQFATPIPLRDKESPPCAVVTSRLEAARLVARRLQRLAELVDRRRVPPDRNALAAVLQTLARDAQTASCGDGDQVLALRDGAPVERWAASVEAICWPPFTSWPNVPEPVPRVPGVTD